MWAWMSYFDILAIVFLISDTCLTFGVRDPLRSWWRYRPSSQVHMNTELCTEFQGLGAPTIAQLGLYLCKWTQGQKLMDRRIATASFSSNGLSFVNLQARDSAEEFIWEERGKRKKRRKGKGKKKKEGKREALVLVTQKILKNTVIGWTFTWIKCNIIKFYVIKETVM